jgi:hypothetical protein
MASDIERTKPAMKMYGPANATRFSIEAVVLLSPPAPLVLELLPAIKEPMVASTQAEVIL